MDLLAVDCSTTSCFLECCHQALLAVGIMQLEADVLFLELGTNLCQDTCISALPKSNTGQALDPFTMICQQSCDFRLRKGCAAISEEQDEFLNSDAS